MYIYIYIYIYIYLFLLEYFFYISNYLIPCFHLNQKVCIQFIQIFDIVFIMQSLFLKFLIGPRWVGKWSVQLISVDW